MNIIQFISSRNAPTVGVVQQDKVFILRNVTSTYELFSKADSNLTLEEMVLKLTSEESEDYNNIITSNRLLAPLYHPDPYHTWVTGTGLTHYGSAFSRDKMHKKQSSSLKEEITDSARMFEMGREKGKMINNVPGIQPEWFYKGNGLTIVNPGKDVSCPSYSLSLSEEPELVGAYIIDLYGNPKRIGFALGNEFSDHKMERINYLYLAHSKLRLCSYGPELFIGNLPLSVAGSSKIIRNGKTCWENQFFTGEEHMTHNIANLEYHHFKYEIFRQPGDVHIHFFGTSVMSFQDGIETMDGDVFEVESSVFGKPLKNTLRIK